MAKATKKKKELTIEEKLAEALVPESEQPYPVPENWCWVTLGNITKVIGGGTPSSGKKEYYENGSIPWISPADLSNYTDAYISRGAKNITELGLEKSSARLLPKDTVCLSSRAPIGYVVIAANPISTNQGFKSFLPSPSYNPKYLYWYLKGNKELLEGRASGTTFLELSGSKAAKVEFPLPPLPEQQRIVTRIESLFSKLDEAKEKAQAVVDGFEDRKAAILHKAFTGELTEGWRRENGIRSDTWKQISIKDICDVFSGKGFKEKEYSNSGVKLLRITNVTYGSLVWDDTKYLPPEYIQTVPELVLKPEDIVMALNRPITNGKLKVSIVGAEEKYILYQRVGCLRIINKQKTLTRFLLYELLGKEFLHNVEANLQGSDQPYINLPPLKNITIRICTLEEQKVLVDMLDGILKEEKNAIDVVETILDQIDTMKKSILARAFRGELDTNDPADESAIELLKKTGAFS